MPLVKLDDKKIRVSLEESGHDKFRLVVVFPQEPVYCRHVNRALAKLLNLNPIDNNAREATREAIAA